MDKIKLELSERELLLICDSLRSERNKLQEVIKNNEINELRSALVDTNIVMSELLIKIGELVKK